MGSVTATIRKRDERARRAKDGEKRFEVWLSPERQADLKTIQQDTGLSAQASICKAIEDKAERIRRKS